MFIIQSKCSVCHSGSIGFRRCADGTTVVLMCSECGMVWIDPTQTDEFSALAPQSPAYLLGGFRSGWATQGEIQRAGWAKFIHGTSPDEIETRG